MNISHVDDYNTKITYHILDPFPDNSGHFISVELNDRVLDLDLVE